MTPKIKQQLKAKAHKLKPIVFIGNNGLSENVIKEINCGLQAHELIKIRIQSEDRELKRALFAEACATGQAEAIQLIGGIGVMYRKREEE
ncbi:MAG TPA: ribosome assembly RNA-binding protein YhbY [Gammaproteobacteria bacterium]|jgi:RNA-binding protein|nr:ribosome assembly RNA-binding protein YhbY [Gammaproteobacteria bacterium]